MDKPSSKSAGYTIIEVMVSALILGICVGVIVTMQRKARDLEFADTIQRQAWQIGNSVLDDSVLFHFTRYPVPSGDHSIPSTRLIYLTSQNHTAAHVTVSVSDKQVETWGRSDWRQANISYQSLSAKVRWTIAGTPDSVIVSKRIAQVK